MEEILDGVYRQRVISAYFFLLETKEELFVLDTGLQPSSKILLYTIHQLQKQTGKKVKKVYLTHHHIDHSNGLARLEKAFNFKLPVFLDEHEKGLMFQRNHVLNQTQGFCRGFNSVITLARNVPNKKTVIASDSTPLLYLRTNGHSPGHLVYYWKEKQVLFTGDLIKFTSKDYKVKLTPTCFNYDEQMYVLSIKKLIEFISRNSGIKFVIPSHGKIVFEGDSSLVIERIKERLLERIHRK